MLRNSWLKWFESRMHFRRLSGRTSIRRARRAAASRPQPMRIGETLETRTLLTTFFVDTVNDVVDANDGLTSFREAMQQAEANAGADVIRFAAGLEGAVLNITMGALPTVNESLSIIGTIGNAQTINGAGLIVSASGAGSNIAFGINSVNFNLEPTGAGLLFEAVDDGVITASVFSSRITNSATQGVKFVAHTGGVLNLTLGSVAILSNGDVVQSEGILGEVGVDPAGAESLTVPGNFATANLNFSTLRVGGQFLEGFKLTVEDGGQVTTPAPIRNSTFSDNGAGNSRSGLKFTATDPGTSLSASFDNNTTNKATGHAYEFKASNQADLSMNIVNSRADRAKADALHFEYDNATGTNSVNGFMGTNSGDNGAEILLFNGSVVAFNQFNNGTFTSSVNSGLQVGVLTGSTLSAFNSTGVTASNNGGSGALLTTLASTSNFAFTNLTTNNNVIRGVQIGENMGGVSTKTFNNITATGNKLGQAMGIGVGNAATLNLDINGGTLSSATALPGANTIYAPIRGGSTANLSFDGLTMNNSSSSGIVVDYDQASLEEFNVSNTTSTGNRAVGVALFVRGGSDVDGSFNNVNVSNAGQAAPASGIRVDVLSAGSNADLLFDGVNASGAKGIGMAILFNAGSTGTIDQFDNITANDTGGDGINLQVRGVGTKLTSFNADDVTVIRAGLGAAPTADGFDLSVVGPGAMGNFNFHDLTVDRAGGRGLKVQVENTATLGINVDVFSADSNMREGIAIDVGTVVPGSTLSNSLFSNGTASSNGLAFMTDWSGARTTVRGAGSTADIAFDAVLANSNTLDGFRLDAATGATLTADLRNGVAGLGNADQGVNFLGDGAATTVSLISTLPGNSYDGNGENGFNVVLTNGVTANEITVQGSASTNQQDGVHIVANDATGVTINTLQVTGNNPMMNNNFGDGLQIDLNNVGGLSSLDLSSLTVNDNAFDQINVTLTNMTLDTVSLSNINADGPGAAMGMGDGIELALNNTDITSALIMNRIRAVNNGEDGLELRFLNGATIPAGSVIDIGTFTFNGQHGVNLDVNASVIDLSLTNSMFNMGSIATLSDNLGNGLNAVLNAGAVLTMDQIDHQTIKRNAGNGVFVRGATPSTFISNNSFTNNDISENDSFGFRGIFNSGTFDITIGGVGSGNLLDDNAGAGIAIDMVQSTVGQLRIIENEITNTRNTAGVFNGEGIFIRQLGTVNPAQATNSLQNLSDPPGSPGLLIQGNRIGVDANDLAAGNSSHGIQFQSEEQSSIAGLHVHDNLVSNNGADGLNFVRLDQVDINQFQIFRNEFIDNQDDGVEVLGQNDTTDILFVTINDNEIRSNGDNGLSFQVNADARIRPDIGNNMIVQNGTDGIQTREVILDISDQRAILGSWTNNVIADNARNGIRIGAVTSSSFTSLNVVNNKIGATFDQFGQVIFDGNGNTGIEINGAGTSTWTDNDIIRNGRAVQNNRAVGHGVDIQGAGFKSTTLRRNLIRENFQDGVEFVNNTTLSFTLNLDDNRIQQNVGRGLDVLNQENTGYTTVSVFSSTNNRVNNQFSSNGEEGIYIVNTSSTTQNQTDFSGTALQQDGATNRSPQLELLIEDATISNNGSAANTPNMIASAGLLLRVGSSQRSATLATAGTLIEDFATNGSSSNVINGGVSAELSDLSLHGNFGDDIFIHGYTSTSDPATLNGTWTDMMFQLTNPNNGDPLARLDLIWNVSDFDSVDVNNSTRRGTPGGEAGAYYSNAEATFKSRPGNQTPPGPHANNGAGRRRNAQRVPARTLSDGSVLDPGNGPTDFGRFLFPGWGESTFRVRVAGGSNVFGSTSFSPGTQAGELPFSWGVFKPTKTMGNSIDFTEGGPPVPIDSTGNGNISDPNLDPLNGGLGNYDGASITVFRDNPNPPPFSFPEDNFGFINGGGLNLVGNQILKGGVSIASFVDVNGTLTINFTDANGAIPTSADVDQVLRRINYENTSVVPPLPMLGMPSLTLTVVFDNGLGAGGQAVCFVDVDITPVNSQPVIIDMGPADPFVPGGQPIKLDNDGNADMQDAELDALNNYAMATLTIRRLAGTNADDDFTFQNGNGLTLNGGNIQKNGETIATFNVTNGLLTITFTDAGTEMPTSADADNILQQICYENNNAMPPASVTLLVTLNDNGVGGGAPQQGSTTVTVLINDNNAPVIAALGPAEVFVTGEANTLIESNGDAAIADAELDALNGGNGNYNGATLTVARQGGANANDSYGFVAGGGLNRVGNEIRKAGLSIASFVDDGAGTLTIMFTDANGPIPTTADVTNILRQITYANSNPIPPASVTLNVTIDDGDLFPLQDTASVTVFINTAPTIMNLGPAGAFSGTPVLIDNDGNADIVDVQLDALNNYNASMITVARQGGASVDDSFTFMDTGTLTFVGGNIIKNGQAIASFTDDGAGTLIILFTDANGEAPTSTDVDAVLRNILYSTVTAGPAMVTLDVTFNDGGVAGGQKPRQDTESVTVTIV